MGDMKSAEEVTAQSDGENQNEDGEEVLEDSVEDRADELCDIAMQNHFQSVIRYLPAQERELLRLRFSGKNSSLVPQTAASVSKKMNLTVTEFAQMERRVLSKLQIAGSIGEL